LEKAVGHAKWEKPEGMKKATIGLDQTPSGWPSLSALPAPLFPAPRTENTGLEKVICNRAPNANIRYLLLCGTSHPGHLVGAAILSLSANGLVLNRSNGPIRPSLPAQSWPA